MPSDAVVFAALVIVVDFRRLCSIATMLGDGVRHLTAVLSEVSTAGGVASAAVPSCPLWVRLLTAIGVGPRHRIFAPGAPRVVCGVGHSVSVQPSVLATSRRYGRCAPRRIAIAGGQLRAVSDALFRHRRAAVGGGHRRRGACLRAQPPRRPDSSRDRRHVAIASIAMAALIYQGVILSLGMVPLVASRKNLTSRRVLAAAVAAVLGVAVVMIGAR